MMVALNAVSDISHLRNLYLQVLQDWNGEPRFSYEVLLSFSEAAIKADG